MPALPVLIIRGLLNAYLVTIARGVFLEESGKVFQVLLLVPFEVTAHNDNAPVGDAANAATVFPKTDV